MKDEECLKELMELKNKMIKMEMNITHNREILSDIHDRLFGNGKEGVMTTITKHKVYFVLIGTGLSIVIGFLIKILV